MNNLKIGLAAVLLLLSPYLFAQDLNAQLTAFFTQRLMGLSDG